MHIAKIRLKDWKGLTGEYEVGPATAILGANGSGKTGLMAALQFAITGKTSLGGTVDDTLQLCGPHGAEVQVTLDDGYTWTRTLSWDAREAKASMELTIGGRSLGGIKKTEAALLEKVGDFPVMFDLSQFTGLAPDKRRKFVLELCSLARGSDALDAKATLAQLEWQILRQQLGEGTVDAFCQGRFDRPITGYGAEMLTAMESLRNDLPAAFRLELTNALKVIGQELHGDTTTAIAAAIDKADAEKNAQRAEKDRAHGAAQELAARKNELRVTASSVEELQARRKQLLDNKEELLGQIRNQEGKAAARESMVKRIADIEQAIVLRDAWLKDHHDKKPAATLEEKKAELDAVIAEISALKPAKRPEELIQARDDAENKLRTHERILQTCMSSVQMCEASVKAKDVQIAARKASPLGRLREEMTKADQFIFPLVECEGPARTHWNELKSLIEQVCAGADASDLIAESIKLGENLKLAKQNYETSQGQVRELTTIYQAAHDAAAVAVAEYEALSQNHTAQFQTLAERNRAITDEMGIIRTWNADLKRRTEELEESKKLRIQLEADLNNLDAEGGHVPLEQLTEQRDRLTADLAVIDDELDLKGRYLQLESELTKCVAAAEKAAVRYDVFAAVGQAIRVLRESLMVELVRPMLEHIDAFLLESWPLKSYCDLVNDRGRAVFSLGWSDGRTKIALPAMSGAQTQIFGAALLYAMLQIKLPPLRVLGIESAELDAVQYGLLGRALAAKSQFLSNIFYASHQQVRAVCGLEEPWTYIEMQGRDWAKAELAAVA